MVNTPLLGVSEHRMREAGEDKKGQRKERNVLKLVKSADKSHKITNINKVIANNTNLSIIQMISFIL